MKPRESVSDMTNDWILDVLADLRSFARKNDLPKLVAQLEDASLIAAAELTSVEAGAPLARRGDVGHAGGLLRPGGVRRDAG
ncbi:MAG: hypothetical protein QNJ13_07560 [Paracoccaceae bacterium]|nr:hypothetical protein [Paracoccaceae bacterium]